MGLFDIHKPGQGTYARVTTAVLLGLFAAFGLFELYGAIEAWEAKIAGVVSWKLVVVVAIAVAAAVAIGLIINSRKKVDFLIVTEAELRKVSWPTWRQLRQQTIVVIVASLILGAIIFMADWLFVSVNVHVYLR